MGGSGLTCGVGRGKTEIRLGQGQPEEGESTAQRSSLDVSG